MSLVQHPPQQPQQSTVDSPSSAQTILTPKSLPEQLLPESFFTWQAIWSFFMRAPRIRAWLFQNHSPPPEQVVQSLLSGPILTGYVFGSFSERVRSYSFPDIGDLHTVFCSDGDALLGFHFGFQGVQPVLPLLFQVAKDPSLGNPNVIVRRNARQKAPIPGLNCYFAIEFSWFQSGSLAVATSVNPIDPMDKPPTGLTPFFDNAEIRVFNPTAAKRFCKIADLYAEGLDLGHFPHPSSFKKLPDDFLDPPDDYYTLTICEPVDPVYRSTVTPTYIIAEQSFHAQSEFSNIEVHDLSSRPIGGAVMHCDRGEVSSVASPRTNTLWKGYQQAVAHSRRTGIFSTMLAKKTGGRLGKVVCLFGREVRYTFLSTSGINVHGRIQRLCNQLGITYSSPLPDTALMSPTSRDGGSTGSSSVGHFASLRTDSDKDINLTNSPFRKGESMKRKKAHLLMHQSHQGYITLKELAVSKALQPRETTVPHGSDPSISLQSMEGSVPPSISRSANTDMRTNSHERGSQDRTRTRNPKRRRYLPISGTGTVDPRRETAEESIGYARTNMKQEDTKNSALGYPGSSDHRGFSQAQAHRLKELQGMDQKGIACRTPTRRRSFEITDMLSDDSKFYPIQHSSAASEALSSTPETSPANHSVSPLVPQVRNPGISQGLSEVVPKGTTLPMNLGLKPDTPAKKASGTVWTCDRCGVQIRGKKGNLNRHIANKHDNIRAYACKVPNCGRKFQTRLNLVRHETAVHLGRPFTCPSCPRAFKYENDLKGHIGSAHESADATLACDICGSCFGRRSTLNRHKAKVHKQSEQQTSESVT